MEPGSITERPGQAGQSNRMEIQTTLQYQQHSKVAEIHFLVERDGSVRITFSGKYIGK